MNLVWLRNDLRIEDNSALLAAAENGENVIALYVWSSGQHRLHDTAPIKLDFIHAHLIDLSRRLAAIGIALHVIEESSFWKIPDAVLHFAQTQGASAVYFNDEYGEHEKARDLRCQQLIEYDGRGVFRFCDRVLLRPGTVMTQSGQMYSVFTPFARNARLLLQQLPPVCATVPRARQSISAPILAFSRDHRFLPAQWWIGEKATHAKLDEFIRLRLSHYAEHRDVPGSEGTSRLSPYLAIGVISPRQIWQRIHEVTNVSSREGADKFIAELLWREFYQHLLALVPRLSKRQPWQEATDRLPWSHNERDFRAWCEARTGVPIVDAAMRELLQTGWMHNRCRMIVASFLSKNLFIDWRWGEKFFMQHLIDGDFAANNGGWQWSASVGVDAAPYFRVFNPVTQSQRFDPEGIYLRRYLPELAREPAARIHDVGARLNYPAAIVDLKSSRADAIHNFQSLQQTQRVQPIQGGLF